MDGVRPTFAGRNAAHSRGLHPWPTETNGSKCRDPWRVRPWPSSSSHQRSSAAPMKTLVDCPPAVPHGIDRPRLPASERRNSPKSKRWFPSPPTARRVGQPALGPPHKDAAAFPTKENPPSRTVIQPSSPRSTHLPGTGHAGPSLCRDRALQQALRSRPVCCSRRSPSGIGTHDSSEQLAGSLVPLSSTPPKPPDRRGSVLLLFALTDGFPTVPGRHNE